MPDSTSGTKHSICIPLHAIIALHSIARHCISLHPIEFHCVPLHFSASPCIPSHSIAYHFANPLPPICIPFVFPLHPIASYYCSAESQHCNSTNSNERPIRVPAYAAQIPSTPWKSVSYTHLRAHETRGNLVCRLLLEKKKYATNFPPFSLRLPFQFSRVYLRPSVLRCWRALLLTLCVLPFCNPFPHTYIRRFHICTYFLSAISFRIRTYGDSTYVHTPKPHSILRFRPAPQTPDLRTSNLPQWDAIECNGMQWNVNGMQWDGMECNAACNAMFVQRQQCTETAMFQCLFQYPPYGNIMTFRVPT